MKARMSLGVFIALAILVRPACAGQDGVKIGILSDMSGPYASITGPGSVVAAQMAIEDFGGSVLGKPISFVSADHQNKADLGSGIAKRWYDAEGVDAIFDVPNSAVALAVAAISGERKKIAGFSGAATSTLTGAACQETTSAWAYDTYSLVNGSIKFITRQGADTWFFVALDSESGKAFETLGTRAIEGLNGKVVGAVRHPINTADFSSFLLQAQGSKAKAVALANAGNDTVVSLRQAHEFRLPQSGQKVVALILVLNDVKALGLETAQGAILSESFYWDSDDDTRAWNKRFTDRHGAPANMMQAGVYSSVLHYLKSVAKTGTVEGGAVAAAMKSIPVEDFYTKGAVVRADGRVMRDMYIFRVKSPSESKGPWDLYEKLGKVDAVEAYVPIDQSLCPLVKR
ncbi:ABC transporter substrate-binding protein [Bradyrhizobium prioriisuperbiae]|uniref:ABC transporter substrate-binding protein n=1 Tax=Bradyrhizobium prioriisuperbiae TaxID=2854389 RepID=UPI0028ED960F|nr:ABC transporter substrate-binding protein [Bradyrhizobium prioritasuperba]